MLLLQSEQRRSESVTRAESQECSSSRVAESMLPSRVEVVKCSFVGDQVPSFPFRRQASRSSVGHALCDDRCCDTRQPTALLDSPVLRSCRRPSSLSAASSQPSPNESLTESYLCRADALNLGSRPSRAANTCEDQPTRVDLSEH